MIKKLTKLITNFRDARDWKQFHTSTSLAQAISVEAAELLELHLWGKDPGKEKVKSEASDIAIFLIQFADLHGFDLGDAIREKMEENDKSILAVILSFFIPGLGQLIKGQFGKAVTFFLFFVVSVFLMFLLIGFILHQ